MYTFPFQLTIGGIFEALRRDIPVELGFQNERQRNATWLRRPRSPGRTP